MLDPAPLRVLNGENLADQSGNHKGGIVACSKNWVEKQVCFVFVVFALVGPQRAAAWDYDFHQHLTTLAARDLGYGQRMAEVAGGLSTYTDVSLASGPFLIPNSRVYMHFNGFYPARLLESRDQISFVEGIKSFFRNTLMVSDARSPVPHAFFSHAMKERDLIGIFGHLHSIQDLEPHAGFYSLDGHRDEGNNPDRYWVNDVMVEKFKRSVRQTYVALWAARQLLPPGELDLEHGLFFLEDLRRREDPQFRGFSPEERARYLDEPLVLAEAALNHPDMIKVYTYQFLRDPEYVMNGIVWFMQSLQQRGIVAANVNFERLLPKDLRIDGQIDLPEAITQILAQEKFMQDGNGHDLFNRDLLVEGVFPEFSGLRFDQVLARQIEIELASMAAEDPGQGDLFRDASGPSGEQDPFGHRLQEAQRRARLAIAGRITVFLGKGYIPMPINSNNHVDSFVAPEVRLEELEIRQRRWNDLLEKHTGVRVAFDPRALRTSGTLGLLLRRLPFLHPELFAQRHVRDGSDGDEEIVTIPHRWRLHWLLRMIRKVIFVSPHTVFDPAFLKGATDYQNIEGFKRSIAQGDLKPFSQQEIDQLMASHESGLNRLLNRILGALGAEASPAPSVDQEMLSQLKACAMNESCGECAAALTAGAEDQEIDKGLEKLGWN